MLIQISNQWQSLNALSGIAVGTAMMVQSQCSSRVFVKQQSTQPASGSMDAAIVEPMDLWQVTSGSPTTWVRCNDTAGQLFLEVL